MYTYDLRSLHTPLRYCDNSTSPPDLPSLQLRAARPPQGHGMLGGGIGFLSIFSAFDSTVRIDSPDSQLRSGSYQNLIHRAVGPGLSILDKLPEQED